jgi:cytochrome-b5 reductase
MPQFDTTTIAVTAVALLGAIAFMLRKRSAPKALDPTRFIPFKLVEKKIVSHDTRIFRFALQSPEHILGLPIGHHMHLQATIDGKPIMRTYTPITSDDDKGYFELMIKVYFADTHPNFPEGGKMTQHLERMSLGDTIDVKGPSGRFEYLGKGKYQTKVGRDQYVTKTVKKMAMMAGGTGITPMLQVIRAVLKDPTDTTQMWLLFGNQTEDDILLRPELEACAKDPRFKLWYTVDRPPKGWSYSEGFISLDMIKERLPAPCPNTVALMCGPGPMVAKACKPNLIAAGYDDSSMFTF